MSLTNMSIEFQLKYWVLLRTISSSLMYSSSTHDLTDSSLSNTKRKKTKKGLYLPWYLGRAQPHTTKHLRLFAGLNSTMTSWKETGLSSYQVHWIIMAGKTQGDFSHIREGEGQEHFEYRHHNVYGHRQTHSQTHTNTHTVHFPTTISRAEMARLMDRMLNSPVCRGELGCCGRKVCLSFSVGPTPLLRGLHSNVQKWQIQIFIWTVDQKTETTSKQKSSYSK